MQHIYVGLRATTYGDQNKQKKCTRDGTVIIFILNQDKNTHNKLIVVNLNYSHKRHNCELKDLL